jgi:uncharacterized protein (DUF1778 family)
VLLHDSPCLGGDGVEHERGDGGVLEVRGLASVTIRSRWVAGVAGLAVQWPDSEEILMATTRLRSERLEVRATKDERALIDRAVAEQGTDLTEFVISNLTVAARRVLADRTDFVLGAEAAEAWDEVNRRRPRDLPGLRHLMERPSPFADE